jgi:predicted nucleotide-binding protein
MAVQDDLRELLHGRGIEFTEEPCQFGIRFRCAGGEVFTAYDKGTIQAQGAATALAEEVKAMSRPRGVPPGPQPVARVAERAAAQVAAPDRRVFIVYGHDTAARDNLELVLHRMRMEPIILQNVPADGDTIIEKLERYLGEHSNVGFACVLLTPDDEGHPAGQGEQKRYRARQNVILELGMVLAKLGRRRVVILHKGSVELPSDIAGLIYEPFAERVEEVRNRLYHALKNAGYDPHEEGL